MQDSILLISCAILNDAQRVQARADTESLTASKNKVQPKLPPKALWMTIDKSMKSGKGGENSSAHLCSSNCVSKIEINYRYREEHGISDQPKECLCTSHGGFLSPKTLPRGNDLVGNCYKEAYQGGQMDM
jgi:hypothetical protein